MTRRAGLRIALVTPAPRGSRVGNRVTAERWARLLRALGHRVRVLTAWSGEPADALIALHATKSARSVQRFAAAHPGRPLVVALAGTDLSHARHTRAFARSLELATRIVALQPLALKDLPPSARRKTRVILQSAETPRRRGRQRPVDRECFVVVLLAHLRPVKDPLLAARAARRLPAGSRVVIVHAGAALGDAMERAARREMARNPRYLWLGELSHGAALRLLDRARALVLTSRTEGAPAVISEAAVRGIPILCTRIPGTQGLLGPRHPGAFPVADAAALAALLARCEQDPAVLRAIGRASEQVAHSLAPAAERRSWKQLLEDIR